MTGVCGASPERIPVLPVVDPHGMGVWRDAATVTTYRFDRDSFADCDSHHDRPASMPSDLVQNAEAMAETPIPAGTGVKMRLRV